MDRRFSALDFRLDVQRLGERTENSGESSDVMNPDASSRGELSRVEGRLTTIRRFCASRFNKSTQYFRNYATMSSRSQRVNKGIDSLVRQLLVEIPGEDAAAAEERELSAVDFVREVLER
jgi:hypothetical protein